MSDEHQSATETLMYSFDYPMLTESGLIKICDKRIVLQFPEKPTVHVKNSVKITQNITMFIENQHCFSLDWIPMHTWSDYFRVKDMIEKCIQAYNHLLANNTKFWPHTFYNSIRYHDSITTDLTTNTFSLSCCEQTLNTCIQLSLVNAENNEKEILLHFQLCIGKHIVFCTQQDLKCITQATNIHFIVQFFLIKLLNF
jgi:hypothetical protein